MITFFLNRWIKPVVKSTNLFLLEAFIGGSDAATATRAGFGVLFTLKNCKWGTNFQCSFALWNVLSHFSCTQALQGSV